MKQLLLFGGIGISLLLLLLWFGMSSMMTTPSLRLVRLSQLDPRHYASEEEYEIWAASACSAASMTAVLNAYSGYERYRITDILQAEREKQAISPEHGMLFPEAIARTVALFGFQTVHWNFAPDERAQGLNKIIATANNGYPVIVNFPPQGQPWTGGHLLVLRGGSSQNVFLADSSSFNIEQMERSQFLSWWGGSADVVFPQNKIQ